MGGLALPELLAAEDRLPPPTRQRHKAVIMIFLAGGPPHQDMVDLKPDAPAEIRGDYKSIATNVAGIDLCEHMPRLAAMTDKLAIIRSIVGCRDEHTAYQMLTGYTETPFKRQGRPALGSIVSYLHGPVDPAIPPFVGLSPKTREQRWGDPGYAGYLGLAHAPYTPNRGETVDPTKTGITVDRYHDRASLLGQVDDLRRSLDSDETLAGMDSFNRAAFEILTSRKLIDALDVTKEDPRLRAKYGIGNMKQEADGPPCCMDHFLMARRLVEAGARCVTISFGRWDTHGNNFRENARRIPKLDMALSALIDDLTARGRGGGRLGRVRPNAEGQQTGRSRPLGAGVDGDAGVRRLADGAGDRCDRQGRRLREGPAGARAGGVRLAVSAPGDWPRDIGARQDGAADVLARQVRGAARAGVRRPRRFKGPCRQRA
jgi:hypothetical protein